MDLVDVAAASALVIRCRKNRRKEQGRPWMLPKLNQRLLTGKFQKFFDDIRSSEAKFSDYFQMSVQCFDELLKAVGPRIKYQNTVLRLAVPPEERLAVTLRYLSTGCSFHSLHCEYLLGMSTISEITKDTCAAIWNCLEADYMPALSATRSEEAWSEVADSFYRLTSFPNCIGAVGLKWLPTKNKSRNSRDNLYTLLVGVANADYSFGAVEAWTHDKEHFFDFFKDSKFGRALRNGELKIPGPRCLPNDEEEAPPMPFVFAAGEAFPVSDHMLRPYPERRSQAVESCRLFNYRLGRAGRMFECCVTMVTERWRILHKTLDVNVSSCSAIVKAVCMLHNFVHRHDGIRFQETLYRSPLQDATPPSANRGNRAGLQNREYFAQYFASPRGSVPWQYEEAT